MKEKIITGATIGLMSILISVNLVRGMATTETYTPEKVEVVYQAPKVVEVAADEYLIQEPETETEVVEEQKSTYTLFNISVDDETQIEIQKICEQFEIDYRLVIAIGTIESDLDFNCVGDYGNSFGYTQIQPKWWSDKYNQYGAFDLFNPIDATIATCVILDYFRANYGDEYAYMLNAYNTGDPLWFNGYSDKVMTVYKELETK